MGTPKKALKNPFDRMGREHLFRGSLNGGGVALVFFQGLKVNQVAAGVIHQEAKQLFENLRHRLALGVFADGAKKCSRTR